MYEVEVKVRADHGPVRARLDELGATARGTVTQTDVYYDHPTREFGATDEALRLRRESSEAGDARAILTYKGPLVDDVSKTREEVQTAVDDPGAVDALLRAVGFAPAAEVRKERERFAHDGYTVTLDTVEGLGTYVEIEAEGAEDDVDRLRAGAFELLSALGLDPNETVRTSYLAMRLDEA